MARMVEYYARVTDEGETVLSIEPRVETALS